MRVVLHCSAVAVQPELDEIRGLLLPFGVSAHPSSGPDTVLFAADGTHEVAEQVWLNTEHDRTRPVGIATGWETTPDGVCMTFSMLPTQAGRDAMIEARHGARVGLSVEAEVVDHHLADGVAVVTASRIVGAAHVVSPAFEDAKIAAAAPAPEEPTPTVEEPPMPEIAAPILTAARMPTAGEWIHAAATGDAAAMTEMVRAAAPHTFVADVGGLVPDPIVGQLMKAYVSESPLFDALGNKTAPNTNVFTLPSVTTRLTPATAATEKSDVTAQLVIGSVTVDMIAIKRAINLSEEAILYSQLDLLGIAAEQLTESVISGRETVANTALGAATSQNAKVTLAANGSDAWSKLAGAAATAATAVGSTPNLASLTLGDWAKLAGMTNTLGQPLVQGIGQDLSGGYGLLFGLPIVVSPQATKSYLVDRRLIMSWSNGNVRMRVDEPTILGRALGALHSVGVSVASGKGLTEIAIATS